MLNHEWLLIPTGLGETQSESNLSKQSGRGWAGGAAKKPEEPVSTAPSGMFLMPDAITAL
jgi:hypothetical protein